MSNLDLLVLPDGTRMNAFALSGSVSTAAYAMLSGAVFTGDVKITESAPSFILNNTNATNQAGLIFHRSSVFKANVALEDTTDNLILTVLSGKKFKMSWTT